VERIAHERTRNMYVQNRILVRIQNPVLLARLLQVKQPDIMLVLLSATAIARCINAASRDGERVQTGALSLLSYTDDALKRNGPKSVPISLFAQQIQ
jgi:hypothetical protein